MRINILHQIYLKIRKNRIRSEDFSYPFKWSKANNILYILPDKFPDALYAIPPLYSITLKKTLNRVYVLNSSPLLVPLLSFQLKMFNESDIDFKTMKCLQELVKKNTIIIDLRERGEIYRFLKPSYIWVSFTGRGNLILRKKDFNNGYYDILRVLKIKKRAWNPYKVYNIHKSEEQKYILWDVPGKEPRELFITPETWKLAMMSEVRAFIGQKGFLQGVAWLFGIKSLVLKKYNREKIEEFLEKI